MSFQGKSQSTHIDPGKLEQIRSHLEVWKFVNPPPNFWRFFANFFIYPSVVFEKLLSRERYPDTENQKMKPVKSPKSAKIDVLGYFKSKIPFAKFKKVPFFGKSLKKSTFFDRIFNLATGISTKHSGKLGFTGGILTEITQNDLQNIILTTILPCVFVFFQKYFLEQTFFFKVSVQISGVKKSMGPKRWSPKFQCEHFSNFPHRYPFTKMLFFTTFGNFLRFYEGITEHIIRALWSGSSGS